MVGCFGHQRKLGGVSREPSADIVRIWATGRAGRGRGSAKTKELMALAHGRDAALLGLHRLSRQGALVRTGCTRAEVERPWPCASMGGGPALMYAAEALAAWDAMALQGLKP